MEAQSEATLPSQMDPIRKRLMKCGVPNENLEQLQSGLVAYIKHNRSKLQSVVSALLPGVDEVNGVTSSSKIKNQFRESIKWVQWLMFEEPQAVLDELRTQTAGTQGVCGAVWGSNDIAYRCRTCEHDPTCAICVPCFKAGNHVNHDYSMIHTGGGCCDCGDETAWKSEGFCSRHRGPGQVQPLPPKYAKFAEPVLGALLVEWKERLLAAERVAEGKPKKRDAQLVEEKVAYKTTSVIVEMLLSFCECSESLLNFIATLMCSSQYGLLDILLRTEQFLHKKVVAELHELLFKLLGEPNFKYEFAKAFIRHYPMLMSAVIREGADGNNANAKSSDYPILSNFSVQIFTVPTLTPRLVTEVNLLDMLLGNLKQLFVSCAGEDGRLLATKGPISNQVYIRLVEDIRYVMSHLEVAKYVARERPDLSRAWIQLLAFMQGMDPQKRVTSIHVEEENEHWLPSFILEFQMAPIHSLYVTGAASVDNVKWIKSKILVSEKEDSDDDRDVVRHAKIGRLSEESSVVRMMGRSSGSDHEMEEACPESMSILQISGTFPVPYALCWLIFECIKVIDNWLGADLTKDIRKPKSTSTESSDSSLIRKPVHWRGRGGRGLIRNMHSPTSVEPAPRTDADTNAGRGMLRELLRRGRRIASYSEPEVDEDRTGRTLLMASDNLHAVSEINSGIANNEDLGELWSDVEIESLGVLRLEEWPVISYDVSRQDISFHIPLHRMLSSSLHKAMELYTAELDISELKDRNLAASYSGNWHEFFKQLLRDCHPCGFSAFMMEHPLRLKVFSAQVRAGMWRRNGHSTFSLCEYYHSVRWCEDSLELDLFLLQCCAAMAPPEPFVLRILDRFGLSDYLSLQLVRPNEYEPTLAQEMLALIIRIVAERGFCGLSPTETLKKELIRKLSVGDATRSQLLKALPPRLLDNKDLQKTLDTIAIYTHPSGMQQGKYSLRNEYWRELDLYHPRWSSRDLQVAEERYSRFRKESAVAVQLPFWRKPFYPLDNISQIATSRGVIQIIRAVVFYAAFSESSSESRAPDGVLFTALHLLALGLDICSSNTSKSTDIENDEISLHRNEMCRESEKNETMLMDIAFSNNQQQPPPLLAYANEAVYVGGINRPDVSNHQSLLSLLVRLMKKYENGSDQGIDAESNHCNIAVLIRNLLEKFAKLHQGCMHEIEKLTPSIVHHLLMRSGNYPGVSGAGNPEMPSQPSDGEKKKALARERQAAIMEKMKAAQAKFVASLDSTENLEQNDSEVIQSSPVEASEETMPVLCALCRESGYESPTALLTLVQKSRLLSFAESGPPSWESSPKKNGNELAPNERREPYESALDSGSGEMISTTELWHLIQNALDGVNHDGPGPLEVEGLLDILRIQLPVNARTADHHIVSDDSDTNLPVSGDNIEDDSVVEDENDNGKDTSSIIIGSCGESAAVIRKEMAAGSNDTISAVLAEYVAAISRLRSNQQQSPENHSEALSRGSPTLNFRASAFDGFGPNDCDGIHVSSCGHAVHHECLDRYLSSLRQRYNSRIIFEGVHIVDPDQGEFLCPVCRRLANSVLPVLPRGPAADMYSKHVIPSKPHILSLEESLLASSADCQSLQLQQALSLLQNAEELTGKRGYRKTVSWQFPESTKVVFEALFHKLCTMYFPGKGIVKPTSGRINQSLIFWDVFRYSLLSAELAARSSKSDAIARGCGAGLEALYKAVNCSEDSVLSLLLQAAEATQSQNRLTVLLRARGMQLLVGSINYCASRDALSENSLTDNISSLLEHVDQGKDFPDIQFWKRTADPVLVHDSFSSLIWLLFCLPRSLPKATEPFICLVHLFYLVCLVQAIAYAGRSISPESDFSSGSCSFIKSVLTAVSGTVLNQSALGTDDADLLSCPTAVLLRRLTLPYLRRCALLYKLLNSSSFHLQEGGSWESSTVHMADDYGQNGDEILVELEELQQLEKLFQIPCLETILEDKNAHGLALRWCQHLSKETGSRSYRHVVRCLPARPFELMRLPHIYQDLLQCYIKECCPACKSVPDQPALCLLCGTLCCAPSRRQCCSRNECYRHAMTCGAGVGVFLMIRKTNILLQRSARQAPWPSPYLDAFGEEDYDMSRGKPLYLSKERYTALTNMVVSHGLDHSAHVLLQTTRDTVFII
jgi:hypothetical protein